MRGTKLARRGGAMAGFLIVLGLVILVVGLLWPYLSNLGLRRVPGDRHRARKHYVLFPAGDVLAAEPVPEPHLVARTSMMACHSSRRSELDRVSRAQRSVSGRNGALQTPISGLLEIGNQICASRVNPTCVGRNGPGAVPK